MQDGVHIPSKDMFKTLDYKIEEHEDGIRDIAVKSAVKIPEFNDAGTPLTRCGSRNGSTKKPDYLPETYFVDSIIDKHNASSFYLDTSKSVIDSTLDESKDYLSTTLADSTLQEDDLVSSVADISIAPSNYEDFNASTYEF